MSSIDQDISPQNNNRPVPPPKPKSKAPSLPDRQLLNNNNNNSNSNNINGSSSGFASKLPAGPPPLPPRQDPLSPDQKRSTLPASLSSPKQHISAPTNTPNNSSFVPSNNNNNLASPPLPPRQPSANNLNNYKTKPLPQPQQLQSQSLPNGADPLNSNYPISPDLKASSNTEEIALSPPKPNLLPPNKALPKKPMPPTPNDVQRHTMKPSTSTQPIQPLQSKSQSFLNLSANNNSNQQYNTIHISNTNQSKELSAPIMFEQKPPSPQPEQSLPAQPNHPSLDHLASFTSMRDLKCKEILTTERTYVDNMKILVEVFITPFKAGEGGISKEHALTICANIPDILLVGIELLARLEDKLQNWSNQQTIGDTFKQLTPFLKMYTNYTVGFDNVLNIITECEKNSSFTSFIQKCTEDPKTKKLDLRSYLIQPVQRITRYHMLLEEVIKHTDPSHPDYPLLKESHEKMKQVTSDANDAIKKNENRQKVFDIQKMFISDPAIVAPHREFIFEGTLTKVCRKACKKRVVFLFNDILVYGSSIPPKLILHEKIDLDHCRIDDIPDGNTGGSSAISLNGTVVVNAFQICSNKKSFVVFADTPELKMKWMIVLTETIEKLKEKRKTIKKEKIDHAEAPVWVPDESHDNCTQCNDTFSLLNRRHHCRNCGSLVCGKCSEMKYKLPLTDYKPARVCNLCYETLTANSVGNLKV